ncbi:SdiA-regulated domain-containing protein [Melioribacter sp. Ez-97]|uniref:SdiA-regulated domain-containing protein n=1 Tax=Melioribacter sp. Ez-97 TaxID=3423434 RepID=UPI003ED897ED
MYKIYIPLFFYLCLLLTACQSEAEYYKIDWSVKLSIPEPSGLTYDTSRDKLWCVSDESNKLYLLSANGEILNSIEIPDRDLEGITIVNDSTLAVLSEESRKAVFVSAKGEVIDRKPLFDNGVFNNGPEGIAYDADNKTYWVANEKNPALIIEYDSLFNETERKEIDFVRDVSGLFYDNVDNSVWMISDEDKKIIKLDPELNVIESYNVNIPQMEGIAIDHNNDMIYIVSDKEEKLYGLKLK